MFLTATGLFLVILLASICQTSPLPTAANQQPESGLWGIFKRAFNNAKEWAIGRDGVFSQMFTRTGDEKSSKSSSCCCICHQQNEKSNQDDDTSHKGGQVACSDCVLDAKEGVKKCIQFTCQDKSYRCENCMLGTCMSCYVCGTGICWPIEQAGKGLEKVLCNDCMLETYCCCWMAAKWPFKMLGKGLCKIVKVVCCCKGC